MEKQVDKGYYESLDYAHLERWASYFYQLREVLATRPGSILEVGVGDRVFGNYIKNNTSVAYTSIDVAEDLTPDVVGSVTAMPLADTSFDAVCAFEVLEHLPFESFETALSEMARVSKRHVFVSLPHFGPRFQFFLKLPFLPEIKLALKVPFPKKHIFNGEHYWEIGKRGYSHSKIKASIEKHFIIKRDFVPFENQYHRFFVLEKKQRKSHE